MLCRTEHRWRSDADPAPRLCPEIASRCPEVNALRHSALSAEHLEYFGLDDRRGLLHLRLGDDQRRRESDDMVMRRLGEQPAHAVADGDERLPRRIDGGPVRRGTRQRVEGSSRSDRARGRLRGGGALGQSRRDGQADGARAGRLHSGAQRVVRSQRIEPELDVLDAQPVQPRLDCQRAAAA